MEEAKTKKTSFVQDVFSKVAHQYDRMNDIMSFGIHRLWKNDLVKMMSPCKNDHLLDLAGGTGDIAFRFIDNGGGRATVADLNQSMLDVGKDKGLLKYQQTIDWVNANAESLPFESETFSTCSIVFGIRNIENIPQALSEIHRVLKKGGKMFCMEFDRLGDDMLSKAFAIYYDKAIPKMGKLIVGDKEPYQYLVESIKNFPAPQHFKEMIHEAQMINICDVQVKPPVARTYIAYKQ